jgi:hypothetical protein
MQTATPSERNTWNPATRCHDRQPDRRHGMTLHTWAFMLRHRIQWTAYIDVVQYPCRWGLGDPVTTAFPEGWEINAATIAVQHLQHTFCVQSTHWVMPAHTRTYQSGMATYHAFLGPHTACQWCFQFKWVGPSWFSYEFWIGVHCTCVTYELNLSCHNCKQ